MKRSLGTLGVISLLVTFADPGLALANCQNEGPYPVTQCATRAGTPAWYAPKPVDAGAVSATWWILGSGNRPAFDPSNGVSTNPVDGDGFIDTPNPGIWIGVDSGRLTVGTATGYPTGGLDLIDAEYGSGSSLAIGGLCFSASANWALPFVDGCSDQNRTYGTLGHGANASDNYLNPYFSAATGGPGIPSDYAQVDSPMGVLLTESNNKYFAIAFLSATNRHGDPNDIFDRGYDMGAIINGDDNPAAPNGNDNIVPWQEIPQLLMTSYLDPNGNRFVFAQWGSVRLVHDNSSRPNISAMVDVASSRFVLGTDRNGVNLTGVGVMEQPELVSYTLETKQNILGLDCDPNQPWVAAPPVIPPIVTPGGAPLSMSVTVPDHPFGSCVRLVTRFGRIPSETLAASPVNVATRNRNRGAAQAGNLGDIGYEVVSVTRKTGGPLSSDKPVLNRAFFDQRKLVVEFQTLGEMALESFEVVATDARGSARVLATVECEQCSSGIGSDYRIEVPAEFVRSVRSVHIVAQPSGTVSNEIAVARPSQRPDTGSGRGRR